MRDQGLGKVVNPALDLSVCQTVAVEILVDGRQDDLVGNAEAADAPDHGAQVAKCIDSPQGPACDADQPEHPVARLFTVQQIKSILEYTAETVVVFRCGEHNALGNPDAVAQVLGDRIVVSVPGPLAQGQIHICQIEHVGGGPGGLESRHDSGQELARIAFRAAHAAADAGNMNWGGIHGHSLQSHLTVLDCACTGCMAHGADYSGFARPQAGYLPSLAIGPVSALSGFMPAPDTKSSGFGQRCFAEYIFWNYHLYLHGTVVRQLAVQAREEGAAGFDTAMTGYNMMDVRVMDYEQSAYRTEFWENADRHYEDAAERLALRRMLPAAGGRLVDLGAGFGRLGHEYAGYRQVVLFDYSRTMLQQAVERWGRDPRFVFVAGNVYRMPFVSGCMDTVVMIRVMHHLEQGLAALHQIDRVLSPGGTSILEFANKRNLKAILRHTLRLQAWSPFTRAPVEFVEMNFNFHPDWMQEQLARTRLVCQEVFSVSHLRLPVLKQLVPAAWLARTDNTLFRLGGVYPVGPSVFLRSVRQEGDAHPGQGDAEWDTDVAAWLRCPACPDAALVRQDEDGLLCTACGQAYGRQDGIWDFREACDLNMRITKI